MGEARAAVGRAGERGGRSDAGKCQRNEDEGGENVAHVNSFDLPAGPVDTRPSQSTIVAKGAVGGATVIGRPPGGLFS
jgi:hypothetical protein